VGLLSGSRALVTGGGSGIGAAICRRLAAEGSAVAVVDIDAAAAHDVAAEVRGAAYPVDVTDPDALRRAVDDAAGELGGLDILCNNAGTSSQSPLADWDPSEWDRLVRVNLTSMFYAMRAAVPHLLRAGSASVVNTASISGLRPAAGEAPYAAAKAGVVALTASAALEYAPAVRVNAVSPGMILTKLTKPIFEVFPDREDHYRASTPLRRIGTPDDVADVVMFLCSDMARFVTGQNLVVDGGMTLHGSAVDGIFERLFHRHDPVANDSP
jgi:NAD(P)-dependent dehydrogenase (short-subunit alcohol dehydrogenase family)